MAIENSSDDLDDLDESMVTDELSSVEEKCEEYIELYRNGDAPGFADFAARTPALESQILELLPTIIMMEGARSRNLVRRKDGRVMRGPEQITKLGDYRIIRELGRGGMGIVYEAHQLTLNRLVAIKLLPKYMLSDDQAIRFKLEASMAAKLHHNNIAPIYGVGESSGFHYYSMQLLDGTSLDQFVDSETDRSVTSKRLTIAEVLGVGRQVASALQYAHDQGVLHRDIKPSNLILEDHGMVWMTDFGLAISLENADIDNVSRTSGTLRYMAPEKFDGVTDDVTGDIYSLGITLIELLTGRPAFSSERMSELASIIKSGKLNSLSHERRALPSDLEAVLRKSIAVDPADRYQTAGEFGLDLKNVAETRPVSARPATMVGSTWRWIKRNRALTAASAIAMELLIATSVISTLAYFRVESALEAESKQRARAEAASQLASNAMDEMFSQFSSGASLIDRSLETNQPYPRLTNESAALAKDLSDFYTQLASQNIDDAELPKKALAARSRVGELKLRLGKYSDAADAFRIAIKGYERLLASGRIPDSTENRIKIAQLANQLGKVKNASGDIAGAEANHQKAIDLLTSRIRTSNGDDDNLELELARSYFLKAQRTRPGMGPNSFPPVTFSSPETRESAVALPSHGLEIEKSRTESLQNAIELLKGLTANRNPEDTGRSNDESRDKSEDAARYLLALCYRELANDNLSELTDSGRYDQAQAIELLEGLVKQYPADPVVQFELMRTLAEINVFDSGEMDPATLDEAYAAVQQAIEIGLSLAQSEPDIAIYRAELIHCNFKLGRIAELKSKLIDAGTNSEERESLLLQQEQSYRRAMQRQNMLARTYPNSSAYRVWEAMFTLSLAGCEAMREQTEARDRLIGRATAILNRLPPDVLEKREVEAILREANRMNRQSLAVPNVEGNNEVDEPKDSLQRTNEDQFEC